MNQQIKFSIITPSINRKELKKTIKSIDSQSYQNWEHLVYFDGIKTRYKNTDRRTFVTTEKTNNFGNTQRYLASLAAKGDYIMYIDDDDFYCNKEAFKKIAEFILENNYPVFGIFPALRFGKVFLNIPPALSRTVSCQFFHKAITETDLGRTNLFWKDPETSADQYALDGKFINELEREYGYTVLRGEPLVSVDFISRGNYEPSKP